MKILVSLLMVFAAFAAFAQTLPDPGTDAFVNLLIEQITKGDYRYVAVLVVIGLTFLARTYGTRIPGKVGEFLATSRGGAVTALVLALVTGLAPPVLGWVPWSIRVVFDVLMAGFAAIGGWVGVRRIVGVVPPPVTDAPPVPG